MLISECKILDFYWNVVGGLLGVKGYAALKTVYTFSLDYCAK